MKNIKIKERTITVNNEYISLTDIARYKNQGSPDDVIKNWMRNKDTLDFLGMWERINNSFFKPVEFDGFKSLAGYNSFVLAPQKWIKSVNAIGLTSKSGRYGGTFAHKDIAFEFASWISPEFKFYLIREFQRLKSQESDKENLDWNAKRHLTKINYKIHTDSIKENIIIPNRLSQKDMYSTYASEADILNKALFGMTSKDWKQKNKNKTGNIRDYATIYQLICLSNLESLNSEFIKMYMTQKERLFKLNNAAISQMKSLLQNNSVKKLN